MSKTSLSVESRQDFIRLIAEHTGFRIRQSDQDNLSDKILSRMKEVKISEPEQYYQFLASSGQESRQEWQKLVILLTNLESYFFRDKGQFNLLRNKVIPEIIKQNIKEKELRICSAGCSTGEEPYSMAIMLKELIPEPEKWKITILGVDINQEAIKKARRGLYNHWSFRSVDEQTINRYFKGNHNNQYQIDLSVKQLVKFQQINLVKDIYPQNNTEMNNFDLIVCRNVFIYFDVPSIQKVVDKFYECLKPSRYFITGHAELSGLNLAKFNAQGFPESVVYQKRDTLSPFAPIISFFTGEKDRPTLPSLPIEQPATLPTTVNSKVESLPSLPQPIQPQPLININLPATQPEKPKFTETKPFTYQTPPKFQTTSKIEPLKKEETVSNDTLLKDAENLFHQKNYEPAIAKINQVLTTEKNNFTAHHLLSQIYANRGKYEEAIKSCNQALEIKQFAVEPYYLLAQIAEDRGETEEAKKLFKKIIYLEPSSLHAYLELGHIYQVEGDETRSEKMLQSALNLLQKMPPDKQIPERNNITVAELIASLEPS